MAATSFFGGEFFGGEFFNSGTTPAVTTAGVVRGHRLPLPKRRMVLWRKRLYWEDDPDLLRQIEAAIARAEDEKKRKSAKRRGRALPEVPKFDPGYVYVPQFPNLPNVSAIIEQQRMIGEALLAEIWAEAARRYLRRVEEDEEEALIALLLH